MNIASDTHGTGRPSDSHQPGCPAAAIATGVVGRVFARVLGGRLQRPSPARRGRGGLECHRCPRGNQTPPSDRGAGRGKLLLAGLGVPNSRWRRRAPRVWSPGPEPLRSPHGKRGPSRRTTPKRDLGARPREAGPEQGARRAHPASARATRGPTHGGERRTWPPDDAPPSRSRSGWRSL
jgi:hypothetical protein